jgi:hypothetical protein
VTSARQPKGVYSRPTPDWLSGQLATVGLYIANVQTAFNYQIFSLYNDASDGRSLYVYMVAIGDNENTYWGVRNARGTSGTFHAQARLARSAGDRTPGQIWALGSNTIITPVEQVFCYSQAAQFATSESPLWIVAPGYRLEFGAIKTVQLAVGMGFWFVPLKSD